MYYEIFCYFHVPILSKPQVHGWLIARTPSCLPLLMIESRVHVQQAVVYCKKALRFLYAFILKPVKQENVYILCPVCLFVIFHFVWQPANCVNNRSFHRADNLQPNNAPWLPVLYRMSVWPVKRIIIASNFRISNMRCICDLYCLGTYQSICAISKK